MEWFNKLNPERRPTILFAPGVKESIWFAEQLAAQNIRAAHIDGDGYWFNGQYENTNDPDERGRVLDELRSGGVQILCNRFVAREDE